jgi:hypothetical protein
MLEEYAWRGSFFVTTDWIGRPGFLNDRKIQELDKRGHVIGSHSCSHPERMSRGPWKRVLAEWEASTERLVSIVSHAVKVASVLRGFYSCRVAEPPRQPSSRLCLPPSPRPRVRTVNGCRVLGGYTAQRGMGPEWPAGFAAGKPGPVATGSALEGQGVREDPGRTAVPAATRGYT